MKNAINILNNVIISIMLVAVYLVGVGLTALFVKIVSVIRQNGENNSYWENNKNSSKSDYESAY